MKKILILLLPFFLSLAPASAKKVKFSVDMDTVTINPTGVHVFGDFQGVGRFPGWRLAVEYHAHDAGGNFDNL
jgi:hypothetical protein